MNSVNHILILGHLTRNPRLTQQRACAAAPPKSGGYRVIWDSALPGFGCRITAAGSRSWVCRALDLRRASDNHLMWFATLDEPKATADREGYVFDLNDITWIEE